MYLLKLSKQGEPRGSVHIWNNEDEDTVCGVYRGIRGNGFSPQGYHLIQEHEIVDPQVCKVCADPDYWIPRIRSAKRHKREQRRRLQHHR